DVGIPHERANELIQRWGEVEPWPETKRVLRELIEKVPVAVVSNSSIALAEVAVSRTGISIPIVITAEEAGYYKPHPQPYRMALERLRCKPEHVIFVAGSASDIPGASGVGMPVFWHNRMNLRPLDSSAKPRYVSDTLLPLLDIV
ncbi:HAD family hydrolase, partial [Candidatus Parcubacteria bacterium]